jgi:16S rRNA (guanine527-N7)-methyltransferase
MASTLGVALPQAAVERLARYVGLLERWGRVHNLSAIEAPESVLVQHLADSLSIVPLVQRWRAVGGSLVDVGSGAGLPGVVLAVALPTWRVACVDSVGKKTAFVQQVATELRLPNLHAFHARVEDLRAAPDRPGSTEPQRRFAALMPEGADLVVSRAFATLDDFVRRTSRLLGPDGAWLAMKGRHPDAELAEIGKPDSIADVFHVEPLQVPGLAAVRCAVWMRPRPPRPLADADPGGG